MCIKFIKGRARAAAHCSRFFKMPVTRVHLLLYMYYILMDHSYAVEAVEIKPIDEFTNNSPKIFGEILAQFRESHYRCQEKQQLVSKLDRLALDFRQLSNICATLVEKASDWCENCTVLLECVIAGKGAEKGAEAHDTLSEQIVLSSEEFSTAFGDMKKFSQKFMAQLDNGLVDLYNKEEEQAKAAEHDAEILKRGYSCVIERNFQNDVSKQSSGGGLPSWRPWGRGQDVYEQPNKVSQDQKLKQEMESAENKLEAAKNTLSDVSDQKTKALVRIFVYIHV